MTEIGSWRRRLVSAFLILAAAPAAAEDRSAAQPHARVTIDRTRVIGTLPEHFLGLSFEKPILAGRSLDPAWGNLAALLRTLTPGGHLWFGGTLMDTQTWWRTGGASRPAWATYVLGPPDLRRLAALTRASGWRVELGTNLGHFDAASTAAEARAAAAALGLALTGIACGNEIDLFPGGRDWAGQRAVWERCADAVRPFARLRGGEEADGLRPAMLATAAPRLSEATSHFYAQYENCPTAQGIRPFTVGDLLSPATARRTAERVGREVALARAAGLPYRISESNSAACLKQAKVGNVYAAALWSVDYLLLVASLGVTGVNMHVPWDGWRLCSEPVTYTALCARDRRDLARNVLAANPLYYGMLLVGGLRPGAMLATEVTGGADLTAYAVRPARGPLQLVLVHKGAPGGAALFVDIPGLVRPGGEARTRLLHAPALTAGRTAVRFAGAQVGRDGRYTPRTIGRIRAGAAALTVPLPAGSAMVVELPGDGAPLSGRSAPRPSAPPSAAR